jgi:hypothetical protein
MENGSEVNGTRHGSRTPSLNGFSLTEYTAVPSPPREGKKAVNNIVPREFLLPNGYPDVRHSMTRLCLFG